MGVKPSVGLDWEGEMEWSPLGSCYRCLYQQSVIHAADVFSWREGGDRGEFREVLTKQQAGVSWERKEHHSFWLSLERERERDIPCVALESI